MAYLADVMKVEINIAALGRSKWYEYLVRFAFGGMVTAFAGIVAKRWGPEIGGLFLAFPAIFPATATLLEKHEQLKKQRVGRAGTLRAREIASVDAAGTAMGSIGLIVFAFIVWHWIFNYPVAFVLGVATLAWLLAAILTWEVRQTIWRRLRIKLVARARRSGGTIRLHRPSRDRRSDE